MKAVSTRFSVALWSETGTVRPSGSCFPPFSQSTRLIDVGSCDPGLSVGLNSLLECRVVQLALRFEDCLQGAMLPPCRSGSIGEREDHALMVSDQKLTT